MFGMRLHRGRHEGRERYEEQCAGRGYGRRHGRGFGRHGRGSDDMVRAGRMLAQGDIRLIALALIAEQPRHGYEIIKVLEEKTSGWYSPSPGMVYPTLTFLEEAGYVTAQADGAKKLFTITDEGRAYLQENKAFVDAVMERFAAIGARIAQRRERENDESNEDDIPRSIRGAFMDLREAVRDALRASPESKSHIIDALDRAVQELKKK
ncbi:MAG: PadR family transcriptional regulator [Xanthobacteraceae bacterium]